MAMIATLVAGGAALIRDASPGRSVSELFVLIIMSLFGGLIYAVIALPLLLVMRAVLGTYEQRRFARLAAIAIAMESAIISLIPVLLGQGQRLEGLVQLNTVLFSFYFVSIGGLVVCRLLGYRLVERPMPRFDAGSESLQFQVGHPHLRFAAITGGLLLIFGLLLVPAGALEAQRRLHVVDLELRRMGLTPEQKNFGLSINFRQVPVSDMALQMIAELKDLKMLVLNGAAMTDARLVKVSEMKSLEIVWLIDTQVTDDGLLQLTKLPNLRRVALGGPRMTDEGITRLKAKLPNVEFEQ
jgi:hypothetical protein